MNSAQLLICSSLSESLGVNSTGMVLLEWRRSRGKSILYLDSMTAEEKCFTIPLLYEPRQRTLRTYRSEWRGNMSTCSLCGEDCDQCRPQETDDGIILSSGGHNLLMSRSYPALLLLLFITIFSV
ncbi:hypothetical protein JOQ06_004685 [Pogonophryne albipinna]|uniref:Uncharacterized protein n=1 Tax=Pogonophryne albipinna TaxID=1090488 RepID=A0AAD6ARQ9_9TELE|nr:hypothetical protein JOQ06_004685 [Pogonophryne albipinna]